MALFHLFTIFENIYNIQSVKVFCIHLSEKLFYWNGIQKCFPLFDPCFHSAEHIKTSVVFVCILYISFSLNALLKCFFR